MESISLRIVGPTAPYKFSYKFLNLDLLQDPNSALSEIQIQIFNIGENIEGNGAEQIYIEFSKYSVIQDMSGNNLSNQKIVGNLYRTESLSSTDETIVRSAGQSMQYSFLTILSANMLLKVAIAVSASYLWTLIHVIQALRFILLININSPKVIGILVNYLAVAVGDIQELEDIVPNPFTYMLFEDELEEDFILPEKFSDNGYESPFIIVSFGKEVTILIGFS